MPPRSVVWDCPTCGVPIYLSTVIDAPTARETLPGVTVVGVLNTTALALAVRVHQAQHCDC